MAKAKSVSHSGLSFIFKSRSLAVAACLLAQAAPMQGYADGNIPQVNVTGKRPPNALANQIGNQQLPVNLPPSAYNFSGLQQNTNVNMTVTDKVVGQAGQGANNGNQGDGSGGSQASDQNGNDTDKVRNITKDENCQHSSDIDSGRFGCNRTQEFLKTAQATNTIMQAGGAMITNTAGQLGQIRAQQAGTQTAAYGAAANTMTMAGEKDLVTGVTNLASGYMAWKKSEQHKANAGKLESEKIKNYSEVNTLQATSNDINVKNETAAAMEQGQALAQLRTKLTDPNQAAAAAKDQRTIGNKINGKLSLAAEEQKRMESDTKTAGLMSMMQGGAMTLSAALTMAAANQARALGNQLGNATGNNFQIATSNPDLGSVTGGGTTAINPGTATDPAVAQADGKINGNTVPTIAPPVNPDPQSGGPGAGPAPGSFQAGNAPAAPGGGSAPGIGVGSMSAAKGDAEPTGPKMAESHANTAYGPGGGSYAATAGGVSAEKSADLGFLANLLPKPQEEMGKNGILDYGTAGRSPASMAPYSFLGKDVNIFQRVSDRTAAKFKNGDVGI